MQMVLLIVLCVLAAVIVGLQLWLVRRTRPDSAADSAAALERIEQAVARLPSAETFREDASAARKEQAEASKALRDEQAAQARSARDELSKKFDSFSTTVSSNIDTLGKHQRDRLNDNAERIDKLTKASDQKADALRQAVEKKLDQLQQSNEKKLEDMRKTVDEKLHKTLETRLGESFKQVSDRLKQVHEGLGKMHELAENVGDLKHVMTNVKSRGVFGEVVLENIITETLTPDQYVRNYRPRPDTDAHVEFAVKIPTDQNQSVHIPIDSKFPKEDLERIYAAGDAGEVEEARKRLERVMLSFGKDIAGKYLIEPATSPYIVLFVPTESLYAELVNRPDLLDRFQQMRVMLAGPTTLMALLHTVRVAYRNQAIQEHAQEIGQMLGVVKDEFGQFEVVAKKMQAKLESTARDFNTKVGRRARAMRRALKTIDAGGDKSPIAQLMGLDDPEALEEAAQDEAADTSDAPADDAPDQNG